MASEACLQLSPDPQDETMTPWEALAEAEIAYPWSPNAEGHPAGPANPRADGP